MKLNKKGIDINKIDLPEVGKNYPVGTILKDEENNLYKVINTFYWGEYEGFTSNPNVSKL
jgi:uncharacterized protein YcfL